MHWLPSWGPKVHKIVFQGGGESWLELVTPVNTQSMSTYVIGEKPERGQRKQAAGVEALSQKRS